MPIGKPSALTPPGIDSAGWPVTLKIAVLTTIGVLRKTDANVLRLSSQPEGCGSTGIVGIAKTSAVGRKRSLKARAIFSPRRSANLARRAGIRRPTAAMRRVCLSSFSGASTESASVAMPERNCKMKASVGTGHAACVSRTSWPRRASLCTNEASARSTSGSFFSPGIGERPVQAIRSGPVPCATTSRYGSLRGSACQRSEGRLPAIAS